MKGDFMGKIYSIGFTKKNAVRFFELLIKHNIEKVIDVRLNNTSQLAGFAKGEDLKFFLSKIAEINYEHELKFAPTKEILDSYKKGLIDWKEYEIRYINLMKQRNMSNYIKNKGKDFWENSCILCSEELADNCHRRLVINEVVNIFPELEIFHIV